MRLSRAAVRLREGNVRVIDVALDFVFESHEGFTRAFSRQFGINPRDFARDRFLVELFMPGGIRDYYMLMQRGETMMTEKTTASTVFVQVIDRPARKLILKRGIKASNYFEYGDEVGCDVWSILGGVKEALYEAYLWECGYRTLCAEPARQSTPRASRCPPGIRETCRTDST